jgi:hypothetical protein
MEERIRRAIEVATQAAEAARPEFREVCFRVVLQAELTGAESKPTTSGIPAGAQLQPEGAQEAPADGNLSLDQFLAKKQPKTERERALVIAYHREVYGQATDTTHEDLDAAYSHVAPGVMARIGSPAQVLRDAKRDKYFDSAGRGRFRLTNRGKKLVEEQLPRNA